MSGTPAHLAPLRGRNLVEASAGTGKTFTITTLWVRAILERELGPEEILVVTYTKAATAELRSRARQRILDAIELLGREQSDDPLHQVVTELCRKRGRDAVLKTLRSAALRMDQAAIYTIHGFCQRLLQDYPLLFGIDLDFELAGSGAEALGDMAADFWASELDGKPRYLLKALQSQRVTAESLADLAKSVGSPAMPILGPKPVRLDDALLTAWQRAHHAVSEIWHASQQEVTERLLSPALNKNLYREKSIRAVWVPQIESLCEEAPSSLPDWFVKLTQANIDASCKKKQEPPRHPFFEACTALLRATETLQPALRFELFSLKKRFVEYAERMSEQRRRTQAVLSYDDLLTTVFTALQSDSDGRIATQIRRTYPVALIDEFQDTDPVQYQIFQSLYGTQSTMFFVGDPKQAIYAFRGADVFSYFEAAQDAKDRKYTLDTNYRSDAELVAAVNHIFSRRPEAFLFEQIQFNEVQARAEQSASRLDPPFELVYLEAGTGNGGSLEDTVVDIAVNEITELLQSGASVEGRALGAADVAVLCRSNRQAAKLAQSLVARGVPASFDGDVSVLDSPTAEELESLLEAVLMPGDTRLIRKALLSSLLGLSPAELASLDDEPWAGWVADFRNWHQIWKQRGAGRFLEELCGHGGVEARLSKQPDGPRRLTDLQHLRELLMSAELERNRDPHALLQWFRRARSRGASFDAIAAEEMQQRPESEAAAVRVTTVHRSKGLEFGVVLCPFLWGNAGLQNSERREPRFHDPRDGNRLKIDLGSEALEEHRSLAERETLAEALRLTYVALTRAKYRCLLFFGPVGHWRKSALGALLHGADRVGQLSEEELEAELEELARESNGVIRLRPPCPAVERSPRPPAPVRIEPRPARRSYDLSARITSFSSLSEASASRAEAPWSSRQMATEAGSRDGWSESGRPPSLEVEGRFADLVPGAGTGLLLHSILEQLSLAALDHPQAREIVERQLRRYGQEPALTDALLEDLRILGATPLLEDGPSLADLDPGRQLHELEFSLHAEQQSLAGLGALLEAHGAPKGAAGYGRTLAELPPRALRGLVRGFVDLLFEWDGRWYVADYKSNALSSYAPSSLLAEMQSHHYFLQSLIYTTAAHRFLRSRLPGYDPAQHWGGALFLFLRGMNGESQPGSGVVFERHESSLLDALDQWWSGGSGC
jgi:exodeoxyribonuclease V beta subunit